MISEGEPLLDGSNIPGNIAFLIREIPLKKAPDGLIRYHSGIVTSLIIHLSSLISHHSSSMKPIYTFTLLFSLSLFLLSTPACAPKFDATGLNNITNIGTKLTDLMNKATGAYSGNSTAATSLLTEIDKAYEHAKAINGNKTIAESWKILKDELVAPFMEKWKTSGKLDKDFIKEAVAQVTKSVTAITNAEKAKRK